MQGVELRTSYCEGSLKKQNKIEVQLLNGGKVKNSVAKEESQSALVHWKGHVQHQNGNQSPHFHYLPIRSAVSSSHLSEHVFGSVVLFSSPTTD